MEREVGETCTVNLAFHSDEKRACCACGVIRAGSDLSACSKCKVYRYCNRDCQAKHWQAHKKTCRAPASVAVVPPLSELCPLATSRPEFEAGDPDLDKQYRYIVVSPLLPVNSEQEFWRTACGVDDDCELDLLTAHRGSTDTMTVQEKEQLSTLQDRFQWLSGVAVAGVPGYCADYNGTDLLAFLDCNSASNSDLSPNATAGYVLMKEDRACRGVVVFAAVTRETGSECAPDSSDKTSRTTISRRDILLLAEYSFALGKLGVVSSRVHFENIRRAESLAHLQSQSYTII